MGWDRGLDGETVSRRRNLRSSSLPVYHVIMIVLLVETYFKCVTNSLLDPRSRIVVGISNHVKSYLAPYDDSAPAALIFAIVLPFESSAEPNSSQGCFSQNPGFSSGTTKRQNGKVEMWGRGC